MTVQFSDSSTGAPDSSPSHDVEDQLQAVPEKSRTTRVGGQFWIWAGANLAPINWVLGALGINLGLGFRDTIIVIVIGNLIGMSIFGFFVLLGQKTGLPAWCWPAPRSAVAATICQPPFKRS